MAYRFTGILFLFLFFMPELRSAPASGDSLHVRSRAHPVLSLRSIQIDYATVVLSNAASVSADIDLIEFPSKPSGRPVEVGIRCGVERFSLEMSHGDTFGTPFTDMNFYVRFTTAASVLRVDTYAGYSYRKSSRDHPYDIPFIPVDRGALKFGFESKWMVAQCIGFMLKVNIIPDDHRHQVLGGLGMVLTWDRHQ